MLYVIQSMPLYLFHCESNSIYLFPFWAARFEFLAKPFFWNRAFLKILTKDSFRIKGYSKWNWHFINKQKFENLNRKFQKPVKKLSDLPFMKFSTLGRMRSRCSRVERSKVSWFSRSKNLAVKFTISSSIRSEIVNCALMHLSNKKCHFTSQGISDFFVIKYFRSIASILLVWPNHQPTINQRVDLFIMGS